MPEGALLFWETGAGLFVLGSGAGGGFAGFGVLFVVGFEGFAVNV